MEIELINNETEYKEYVHNHPNSSKSNSNNNLQNINVSISLRESAKIEIKSTSINPSPRKLEDVSLNVNINVNNPILEKRVLWKADNELVEQVQIVSFKAYNTPIFVNPAEFNFQAKKEEIKCNCLIF